MKKKMIPPAINFPFFTPIFCTWHRVDRDKIHPDVLLFFDLRFWPNYLCWGARRGKKSEPASLTEWNPFFPFRQLRLSRASLNSRLNYQQKKMLIYKRHPRKISLRTCFLAFYFPFFFRRNLNIMNGTTRENLEWGCNLYAIIWPRFFPLLPRPSQTLRGKIPSKTDHKRQSWGKKKKS